MLYLTFLAAMGAFPQFRPGSYPLGEIPEEVDMLTNHHGLLL
jgi:hypothetical protein